MKIKLTIVAYVLLGGACAFAAGSGAFRDETVDAQTLSMGNAFAGEANTPAAVYYNPAGLNQINSTTITLSDAIIAPRADFKDLSGDTTQMRNHEYNVPAFYAVVPIIKNKFTVGVGSGSYWGLGTDWANDSALRYAATQNNLTNIDSMITGAYQVTNQWSVAIGADNDYSKVDENLNFPNSAFDTSIYHNNVGDIHQELKAKDDAWGYRLATMFKINNQNQVGLMYRSPIAHNYIGKAYIDNIGPTYSNALFNGATSYETRVTEKFVLPQSVVLGYSLKPTDKWTINFDLEWMDWSSIKQELHSFPDAPSSLSTFLNTGNPLVHDWASDWSEGIGTEYKITDHFRIRAGFYHHGTVGPDDYFDPAMPDLQAFGITGGFGYDLTKNLTIDVGYSAQMFRPRKVNTVLASGMANGTYHEFINDGVVSLTYKF